MSGRHLEWVPVPSVCRRIAALVVVASLGAALPATPALAQGAGDQQYSDPFGDSGTSTGGGGTSTPTGGGQQLSPTPQTPTATSPSGGSGSGSAGTSASRTSTTPAATGASLPNTGVDARVLVVLGTVLLLTGLGLRLRSAPERF